MRVKESRSRALLLLVLIAIVGLAAGCAGGASWQPVTPGDGDMPGPTFRPDDGSGSGTIDGTKIVYTGSLQLVVADLQAALARARADIGALGGYVSASRESGEDGSPRATVTFRIPSDRWADGLAALRSLATKVVSEETATTDVGAQLVDLEARLRNLRSSETALQEIASNATRVTDLLEVERRLTEVRGEIESLDAQRAYLADQVAYGTLVTTFGLDVAAVSQAAKDWDPAAEVDRATATLIAVVQGLATAGIWFAIVWLPVLLVLGIVALIVRWGVRRYRRNHPPVPPKPRDPVAGWGAS